MKTFKRIEPTTVHMVGEKYPLAVVVKNFQTEDGQVHTFGTRGEEGSRSGNVIALTPENEVIISYQFRAGPERWMDELPGGGIHPGEDPQTGVMRELAEETGYASDEVYLLGTTCRDAYANTVWYYYLALNCTKIATGCSLDQEELDQGAEVKLISIEQLFKNAVTDNMVDPGAVLMAYDKLKELQND